MKPVRLSLLFLTTTVCIWLGGRTADASINPVKTADVGSYPESVIQVGQNIFASNLGQGSDLKKDNDGYISRLSMSGKVIDKHFIPPGSGLHAPLGMAVYGHMLFLADLDSVVGVDLRRRKVTFKVTVPGVSMFNDLTFINRRVLAASATYEKKIFLIDIGTQGFQELQTNATLHHVNGLLFDARENLLYVTQNIDKGLGKDTSNGQILALKLNQRSYKAVQIWTVPNAGKFVDGIAAFDQNSLLVSDWSSMQAEGELIRVNTHTKGIEARMPMKLAGFADFIWLAPQRLLITPSLTQGKVVFFQFP